MSLASFFGAPRRDPLIDATAAAITATTIANARDTLTHRLQDPRARRQTLNGLRLLGVNPYEADGRPRKSAALFDAVAVALYNTDPSPAPRIVALLMELFGRIGPQTHPLLLEHAANLMGIGGGADFFTAADRLAPHRGAAPTLGWLVFGVAMTFLAAWALPDLIAWVHTWGAP